MGFADVPSKERIDPLELVDEGLGPPPAVPLALVDVQLDGAAGRPKTVDKGKRLAEHDVGVSVAVEDEKRRMDLIGEVDRRAVAVSAVAGRARTDERSVVVRLVSIGCAIEVEEIGHAVEVDTDRKSVV